MKDEILHTATQNLMQLAELKLELHQHAPFDMALRMFINNQFIDFYVDIKQEPRAYQIQQIVEANQKKQNYMLVANRIYPTLKEELRRMQIPYLEANGNVFLKKDNLYLYIDTQKPQELKPKKGNRAFTKTGLKVLFYLLQDKDAIHLPHRELAKRTGVALGNIPQVIEGLQQTGFLLPLNNKKYIWENRNQLMERWIHAYGTLLKPLLKKGTFTYKGHWQELPLEAGKTFWGGEPAADLLTQQLRPEKFTLYTQETRLELLRKYRLMPDEQGTIEVYELFWLPTAQATAPPLLVYADLLLEGGKRNNEIAQIIYHEQLVPNL